MKGKKITAILMAVLMVVTMLPVQALAKYDIALDDEEIAEAETISLTDGVYAEGSGYGSLSEEDETAGGQTGDVGGQNEAADGLTKDADGTDAEVDALMNEYDCIEYNDLIDVRNRCDAFFEIAK